MFLFWYKFCKFLSLIEIWGWLTHFSITNFWCTDNYMLKKGLIDSVFNIFTCSMVLCSFLLHLMQIFPKENHFLNKTIVKRCLFAVKYFETRSSTKFSTVNHYLTNCNTTNWLWKKRNYHVVWLSRYKFFCHTKIFQISLANKKIKTVNPLLNKKLIIYMHI